MRRRQGAPSRVRRRRRRPGRRATPPAGGGRRRGSTARAGRSVPGAGAPAGDLPSQRLIERPPRQPGGDLRRLVELAARPPQAAVDRGVVLGVEHVRLGGERRLPRLICPSSYRWRSGDELASRRMIFRLTGTRPDRSNSRASSPQLAVISRTAWRILASVTGGRAGRRTVCLPDASACSCAGSRLRPCLPCDRLLLGHSIG